MVEHVDEDDVRECPVLVRKRLRVDDLRGPRCRLDVGRLNPGTGLLQGADPRAELDRATRHRRKSAADLLEPADVELPHERPGIPAGRLTAECVDE
jgi:hypothetical protein